MSRLRQMIDKRKDYEMNLNEADDEAPVEGTEDELSLDDPTADAAEKEPASDDELSLDDETEESTEEVEDVEEESTAEEVTDVPADETKDDENFDLLDKTIEEMVGIVEIQHTTSSTILDFEDGGQIMFVQPMVSIKSETLNSIIDLIISDVKYTYGLQRDEITGKNLNKTKYWKSIETLVSTMVRSQLTKSDNVDGLIDEIKQVFKVLEVK